MICPKKRYALISVSDRQGVLEFAKGLCELGFNVIATSGTQKFLAENGVPSQSISELTGFPEILSGRVKTLHPKILGAILADTDNPKHIAELNEFGIPSIELVVCNLYLFDSAPGIENIDIGGVTLIRASAKNYKYVTCITQPFQYEEILTELKEYGKTSEQTRLKLAGEAFKLTCKFDSNVASFLDKENGHKSPFYPTGAESLNLSYEKLSDLIYGENPHQKASLYKEVGYRGLSILNAIKLQGKEISFNNLYDLDSALYVIKSFVEPCACILKHATPCGIAIDDNILSAYKSAYRTDTISPFGGIVALNREIDKALAEEMTKTFISAIVAQGYSTSAMEIFAKKQNMVVMQIELTKEFPMNSFRWVAGGLLVQDNDTLTDTPAEWSVVTNKKPTPEEFRAMEFGFKVVRLVKSNAIVISTDKMTLGIGGGQPNRVGSLEIAIQNMKKFGLTGEEPKIIASDAFFPFRDSVDLAVKEGVKAIVQPGGSIRDKEVISACDEAQIAMIFTHKRHFRH